MRDKLDCLLCPALLLPDFSDLATTPRVNNDMLKSMFLGKTFCTNGEMCAAADVGSVINLECEQSAFHKCADSGPHVRWNQ